MPSTKMISMICNVYGKKRTRTFLTREEKDSCTLLYLIIGISYSLKYNYLFVPHHQILQNVWAPFDLLRYAPFWKELQGLGIVLLHHIEVTRYVQWSRYYSFNFISFIYRQSKVLVLWDRYRASRHFLAEHPFYTTSFPILLNWGSSIDCILCQHTVSSLTGNVRWTMALYVCWLIRSAKAG